MIGIDEPIERLRLMFESSLWISNNNSFYGRCFRNLRDGKLFPEISENKNYLEVLLNDKKDSTVFFDVQPERSVIGDSDINSNVDIYFSINLKKIYPLLTRNEATETAYKDVVKLISASSFDFQGLETGFSSFDTWGYDDASIDNMYPYHLFKINTTVIHNLNC